MHYNVPASSAAGGLAGPASVLGVPLSVAMSSPDPVTSLQLQLMMSTGSLSYSQPAAPLSVVSTAADLHSQFVDSQRVPGSPASYLGQPMFAGDSSERLVAAASPASCGSPHTPRNALKSLLKTSAAASNSAVGAAQRVKSEPPPASQSPAPSVVTTSSGELQLDQIMDIKPLLRKPIDTSRLTPEQVERLVRRRERNKVAATKCRIKRRQKSRNIREEYAEASAANEELEQELAQLKSEKQRLEAMLMTHEHLHSCRMAMPALDHDLDFAESPLSHSDCSSVADDIAANAPLFNGHSMLTAYHNEPADFSAHLLTMRPPNMQFPATLH